MAIEALVRRNVKLILYPFVLSTLALLLVYGAWTTIVSTEVIRINLGKCFVLRFLLTKRRKDLSSNWLKRRIRTAQRDGKEVKEG